MIDINLIPAARLAARQRRRRGRFWTAASIVYGTSLFLACLTVRAVVPDDRLGSDRRLAAMAATNDERKQQIQSTDKEAQQLRRTVTAGLAVDAQPDWSVLLGVLAREVGDGIVLATVRVSPRYPAAPPVALGAGGPKPSSELSEPAGYAVVLTGYARSPADVPAVTLRLERTGIFDRVELMGSQLEQVGEQTSTAFELHCRLTGAEELP